MNTAELSKETVDKMWLKQVITQNISFTCEVLEMTWLSFDDVVHLNLIKINKQYPLWCGWRVYLVVENIQQRVITAYFSPAAGNKMYEDYYDRIKKHFTESGLYKIFE